VELFNSFIELFLSHRRRARALRRAPVLRVSLEGRRRRRRSRAHYYYKASQPSALLSPF